MTPRNLPMLITGIAGVPGYNAFRHFHSLYPGQVIGIRAERNWPLNMESSVACNVEDTDELSRLFDRYGFRSILHCAGNCALKVCEIYPELAEKINVTGSKNIARLSGQGPCRLICLSVDLVFSGKGDGEYTEEDDPDPITVYGKTMLRGERHLLETTPEACVLRISLPMGESFNGHAGAIDWIQARFRKHRKATLYYDEIRTPTYTAGINRLFEKLLDNELTGLYHAGASRKLSLYEIGQVINRVGGYRPQDLDGCPRIEAGPLPPRAGNVSLNSAKLTKALGEEVIGAWPSNELLVPTHRDWHRERDPKSPGSVELLETTLF